MRTSAVSNICHSWNNLVQFAEERALSIQYVYWLCIAIDHYKKSLYKQDTWLQTCLMHKTIQWFQSMTDTKRQHSWSTPLLVLNTNINTILYHHGNHLKCLGCVAKPYLLRCLFVVSTKEDGSSGIVPWLLSNQCNIHPPAGLVATLEWFSVSNLKSE